jgi:hypothetical protein
MPGFDGTGPLGQGPRTGGGFGYCPPTAGPYYGQPVVYGVGRGGLPRGGGRGFAYGGGRGRGRRFWGVAPVAPGYYPAAPAPVQMTAEDEIVWLKEQSQMLQDQLNQINERITELTAEQGKK